MDFENKPALGIGIYTASEIAEILRLPYNKVYTWINKYWDGKLGKEFEIKYSWQSDGTRAVSFHTVVEFYVMMRFSEAGVKPKQVLEAHKELSSMYNSAFPFALKKVLDEIKTDGNRVYLKTKKGAITLDGTKQFNLEFIKLFFKKLDFENNELASRFWPMGKENSILIDPERKFGHPVIDSKNIYPQTIYSHIRAGDPIEYIVSIYSLTKKEVEDALEYCNAA